MPTAPQIQYAKRVRDSFFADPLLFVRNGMLMTAYANQIGRQSGGRVRFALVPTDDVEAKTFFGEPVPVFQVVDGTGYEGAGFDGYWCPYENNAVKSTTVWNEGNALFTDRMDGCTFGVGSVGSDGAIRVCHVNENKYQVSANDTAEMERQQRSEAIAALGEGAKLFEPANYRRKDQEPEGLAATTFGVRDPKTNGWAFYAQLTEGNAMGGFVLRAIKKVA